MEAQIYASTSPLRPTLRAIFLKAADWGPERGGHLRENWSLESEVNLAAPGRMVPFTVDEARETVQSNGVFIYQVAASKLQQAEHDLLNGYRQKFTLPLLWDTGESAPLVLGSGTLFEHEGRCFLVTADHIFREDIDDASSPLIATEDVALPDAPRASGKAPPARLITLGRHTIFRLKPPVVADVIVIELLEVEVINALRAAWGFLPLSAVSDLGSDDERFVITGFLLQGAKWKDGVVSQAMLNLETDRYHETPTVKAPADGLDLFLYLQRSATTVYGQARKIDSLRGLSGGPIWSLREIPRDGVWHPSKAMKVVAVQSSEMEGKWARATDWKAVKAILSNIDVGFSRPPFP